MLKYNRNLKQNARRLRVNMTESERLLWSRLRGKQLLEVQFYRQKPIGNYIVDFYAPSAALIVEVDGSQHLEAVYSEKDAQRDAYLGEQGLRVLRFNNLQVLRELDVVLDVIFQAVVDGIKRENSCWPRNPP